MIRLRRPVTDLDTRWSDRFELLTRLGEGAMGVVYEAFDRERSARVALKVLRIASGEALTRFKSEFRALADIHHPNLVHLGELIEERGRWFFTMELVPGRHFLEWVRPGGAGGALDETRLRPALAQLAQGLAALHAAGKVHRDVKPSNVLVGADGRVVVLDFGLVADTESPGYSTERNVVGTAAYMAPEQAASSRITAAADWYAFGAVLYEALTGAVPFEGQPLEVLIRKQTEAPRPVRARAPAAPGDLAELADELLRTEPAARPGADEVLRRLGATVPAVVGGPSPNTAAPPPFVGRRRELGQLAEARGAVRAGHPVAVVVTGPSGVGKSALVKHFADRLVEDQPSTVLLRARCFERESAHFKAADGIVEALARFLSRLPPAKATALLPARAGLLAHVFPALLRVEAVSQLYTPGRERRDPLEQRAAVFTQFRELIARVAAERPVVLVIEDLHWADPDSLTLLAALLRPPGAPGLLLLATAREAPGLVRQAGLDGRELALDVLPQEQAVDLAAALLARAGGAGDVDPAALAREAGGHALFLDELVRHVAARAGDGTPAAGHGRLEDALWTRVQALAPVERRLLEVVSVAAAPIPQETAAHAAGMGLGDLAGVAASLRAAHLARTDGARAHDRIEPYHGRVREVVLAYLDAARVQELHRALALAVAALQRGDDELLAAHWAGAGEPERASHHAERAGDQALEQLAFERATRHFRTALELAPGDDGERRGRLERRLGEALANAGRGAEAARAFLAAAARARPAEALELRRRAAQQLLRSGHIDEGMAALVDVLASVGLAMPASPRRALLGLLMSRARLRLRGGRFTERDESEIAAAELARIDTCWAIGEGLAVVDFVNSGYFQARHIELALAAGEPYRVARGFAVDAAQTAARGWSARARTARALDRARGLAERIGQPHALALVTLMRGITSFLEGRWRDARTSCDAAEQVLRERCTDAWWEVASAQLFSVWALGMSGEIEELGRRHPRALQEAQERGDLYTETNLLIGLPSILWLARDDEAGARAASATGMRRWSHKSFLIQHAFDHNASVEMDLHAGDGEGAYRRVLTVWPMLEESLVLEVQMVRIWMRLGRARAALAAALARRGERDRLLAEADGLASKLTREAPWAAHLGAVVRAGVAATRGRRADAERHLRAALAGLAQVPMALWANAARRRLGELLGDTALVTLADDTMTALGVRRPARLTDMFAPGAFGDGGSSSTSGSDHPPKVN
jgi:hypothetical protein